MKSPKHQTSKSVIIVEDLPLDQKEAFYDWLSLEPIKTTPVDLQLEYERGHWVLLAYADDYDYWYTVCFNPCVKIMEDNG